MFLISLILYLISIGLLTYCLVLLEGIETLIRVFVIITIVLYFFIYLIVGLVWLISKKHKLLISSVILTVIFVGANSFGFYYINKTYNIVDDISKDKIIYTTSLVKLKDNEEDIVNVGMISNEEDVEGYILPQEYIANNDKKYQLSYYDSSIELLEALYNGDVDAIFITANYILTYSDEEEFENIEEETEVVDSYSKKMDNQDTVLSTDKDITEPFTVLLLGVDSKYEGLSNNAAFNGDSIMMITFNPKTLNATVFSIPRDTYVPIACNNNKSYKINSAAGYGTKCMIDTVQNLTGIDIDYYVKINFKGVVSLVDALGGITLDIDEPDYSKNLKVDCQGKICEQNSDREFSGDSIVYITPGENQTLNGEQALAYARNRHQWATSDFKRVEHQQAVVAAIANKAKTIRNVSTFYKVLNAVANNIDTNMTTKQMLNFYNVGKNILQSSNFADDEFINIQKTYLTGYDLTVYTGGSSTYTFQYYEESLNEIVQAMKENLEIEEPELVKTFSFSVNDTYSVPVIGKTYSSVKRNETLPDFTGSSISYLESWASSRSIVIEKNMVEDNSCVDSSVISQNIHSGTLVSSVSNLKVDVCKNVVVNTVTENSNDDSNSNISASNSSSSNSDTSISNSDDQNNDIDEVIESLVN